MIDPVEIVHERDHVFGRPDIKPARGKGRCKICGEKATHLNHIGTPQSVRIFGSGANHFAYQEIKHSWQQRLIDLLSATELPRGLVRVLVEGEVCFPDRGRRDQGNHRFLVEKALGDALTEGGWLEDDDWTRFSFGELAYRHEPRRSWTRLVLFPTVASLEVAA